MVLTFDSEQVYVGETSNINEKVILAIIAGGKYKENWNNKNWSGI